jgi:TATA-box binding protein (TBP) (component of TFIID and TFIIIB)
MATVPTGKKNAKKAGPAGQPKPVVYYKQRLVEKDDDITKEVVLAKCLSNLAITNIVATANFDVKDINLRKLAQKHFFCNYHKCTFAAMGIRLQGGSAALLYSMGVMVCMGTTSTLGALMACTKYAQILNDQLDIKCSITGFQADNYVCTIYTFMLDLQECTRKAWAAVIEYDKGKFPGATVRCKFMNLGFKTDVVMEFFESGKINITGAKSIYEARYMFILVYFRYLRHIKVDNSGYSRKRVLDIKDEPKFNTDLVVPTINTNEVALAEYRNKQQRWESFARIIQPDGKHIYVDQDNRRIRIEPEYRHLPHDEIDKLIMAAGMADF